MNEGGPPDTGDGANLFSSRGRACEGDGAGVKIQMVCDELGPRREAQQAADLFDLFDHRGSDCTPAVVTKFVIQCVRPSGSRFRKGSGFRTLWRQGVN